jgi:hypothetical protein
MSKRPMRYNHFGAGNDIPHLSYVPPRLSIWTRLRIWLRAHGL